MESKSPKLRTVNKSTPAYALNKFPKELPFITSKEIVYLLASKGKANLVGFGMGRNICKKHWCRVEGF